MRLLIFCLFLCFQIPLLGQDGFSKKNVPFTVYMKDGSIFSGQLIKYELNKSLELKVSSDVILRIPSEQIEKIIQEKPIINLRPAFKSDFKGFYNATNFYLLEGFLAGNRSSGLGILNTFGYQWKYWLGTGLGVAYDNYDLNNRLASMPIFVDIRGQFTRDQVAPFYNLQTGYSIGIKDEDENITQSEGGFFIHPALGVIFNSRNAKNAYTLDIGYRFQQYSYRQMSPWNRDFDDFRITYKRFSFRVGILF